MHIILQEKNSRDSNSYTSEDFKAIIDALAARRFVINSIIISIMLLNNLIETYLGRFRMLPDEMSEYIKISI